MFLCSSFKWRLDNLEMYYNVVDPLHKHHSRAVFVLQNNLVPSGLGDCKNL